MDIIQLLPDHIANQIAAGEVIQRPASVVKELIENSVDAGASKIEVFIKDAGKTLIHISDNGCGMSKNDIGLCFIRHATSKIKKSDDLFSIKTMGFRGEALSSITAISQVKIETKLTNEKLGYRQIIEAGELKKIDECVCKNGTSIKVKHLFYNVPARRKFLKSDKIEFKHITEQFIRIALSQTEIKMNLFHNNKEIFHLEKSNFRKRIVNILGNNKNEMLVPIKENTSLVNISGFVCKPENARRTRGEQYFFVNERYIKAQYLNHAVCKAFEGVIPTNYYPSYFIKLDVSQKLIDINIHPTKTEIKFQDEKSIYAIIRSTIKKSLAEYNIAPTIDFSQENAFNISLQSTINKIPKEPSIKINKNYNPFKEKNNLNQVEYTQKYSELFHIKDQQIDKINPSQIGNKFIAYPTNKGLLIIHQRRAHKRILYEKFNNQISNKKIINNPQKLLFPKELQLNTKDLQLLSDIKKEIQNIGFDYTIKNKQLFITSIPNGCEEKNLQEIIELLLEQYQNEEKIQNQKTKTLSAKMANSFAIYSKKKLDKNEMLILKKKLFECEQPTTCPFGKITMIDINIDNLEKYF